MRVPRTRKYWPIVDQKLRVVTSKLGHILKNPTDFKQVFTDVKLLYEKACQVSRQYCCSFFSYREYSGEGR